MPYITEISKATQWRPGQSGNPNGRPVGARQTFSAGFHRDLAEVWQAHGRDSMLHTAKRPFRNWLSGAQLVEQRPGLLQIECVEALDEPTVE